MPSVIDAAYQLVRAYPGGSASLAPRLGKSSTTLSHEVTKTGSAKFGLEDAVAATVLSNDLRILNAFAAEAGCMVLRLPSIDEVGDDSTMRDVAALAREFGDLVSEVTGAAADGQIALNELHKVQREWARMVAAGQQLLVHLQERQRHDSHGGDQ